MLASLLEILNDVCQLDPEREVIVGVSGGPDSLCVMDVLERCRYLSIVAHFNHKLRSEADEEAEIVKRLAHEHGLAFILGEIDPGELSELGRGSIEEAARIARYRFLFKCAEQTGAQAVVVGHTADDQVETVLMHLLRGSGIHGISGMQFRALPNAWSEKIPLVRPLLGVWREQVLEYCREHGFEPVFDSSNLERTYFRNRLRYELIPYLENYNPAFRKVLWRTAEVLRGDSELVNQIVDKAWLECKLDSGPGYIAIDTQRGKMHSLGVQRHLIRRAIATLRPDLRDIDFEAIERGRKYLKDCQAPAEIDLIAGLKLVTEPNRLWVAEWETELPTSEWPQSMGEAEILEVPGSVTLSAEWKISAERVSVIETVKLQIQKDTDLNQIWVDIDRIKLPLIVRTRRDGDRFKPLGLKGHSTKLSDFMINEKMPRRARPGWPLVCSGDQIVWVPGYRMGHPFRITESTQQGLKLSLSRSE
jgi:tRNA(Ile)-lysidine synthase